MDPLSREICCLSKSYNGSQARSRLQEIFENLRSSEMSQVQFITTNSKTLIRISRLFGVPFEVFIAMLETVIMIIEYAEHDEKIPTLLKLFSALNYSAKHFDTKFNHTEDSVLAENITILEKLLFSSSPRPAIEKVLSEVVKGYLNFLKALQRPSNLTGEEIQNLNISNVTKQELLKFIGAIDSSEFIVDFDDGVTSTKFPQSTLQVFQYEEETTQVNTALLAEMDYKDIFYHVESSNSQFLSLESASPLEPTTESGRGLLDKVVTKYLMPSVLLERAETRCLNLSELKEAERRLKNSISGNLLSPSIPQIALRILTVASKKQLFPTETIDVLFSALNNEYCQAPCLRIIKHYHAHGKVEWTDKNLNILRGLKIHGHEIIGEYAHLLLELDSITPEFLCDAVITCLRHNVVNGLESGKLEEAFLKIVRHERQDIVESKIREIIECLHSLSFHIQLRRIAARALIYFLENKQAPSLHSLSLENLMSTTSQTVDVELSELLNILTILIIDREQSTTNTGLDHLVRSVTPEMELFSSKLLVYLAYVRKKEIILNLHCLIPFLTSGGLVQKNNTRHIQNPSDTVTTPSMSLSLLAATIICQSGKAYEDASGNQRVNVGLTIDHVEFILKFVSSKGREHLDSKMLLSRSIKQIVLMANAPLDGLIYLNLQSFITSADCHNEIRIALIHIFLDLLQSQENITESIFQFLPHLLNYISTSEVVFKIIQTLKTSVIFNLENKIGSTFSEIHFPLIEIGLASPQLDLKKISLELVLEYLKQKQFVPLPRKIVSFIETNFLSSDKDLQDVVLSVMHQFVRNKVVLSDKCVYGVHNFQFQEGCPYPFYELREILCKINENQDLADNIFLSVEMDRAVEILRDAKCDTESNDCLDFLMQSIESGYSVTWYFFSSICPILEKQSPSNKIKWYQILNKIANNSQKFPVKIIAALESKLNPDNADYMADLFTEIVEHTNYQFSEKTCNNVANYFSECNEQFKNRIAQFLLVNSIQTRSSISNEVFSYVLDCAPENLFHLIFAYIENICEFVDLLDSKKVVDFLLKLQNPSEFSNGFVHSVQLLCKKGTVLPEEIVDRLYQVFNHTSVNYLTKLGIIKIYDKYKITDPRISSNLMSCHENVSKILNICKTPRDDLQKLLAMVKFNTDPIPEFAWQRIISCFIDGSVPINSLVFAITQKMIFHGCALPSELLDTIYNSEIDPDLRNNFFTQCHKYDINISPQIMDNTNINEGKVSFGERFSEQLRHNLDSESELQEILERLKVGNYNEKFFEVDFSKVLSQKCHYPQLISQILSYLIVLKRCRVSKEVAEVMEDFFFNEKVQITKALLLCYKFMIRANFCLKRDQVLERIMIKSQCPLETVECILEAENNGLVLPNNAKSLFATQHNLCEKINFTKFYRNRLENDVMIKINESPVWKLIFKCVCKQAMTQEEVTAVFKLFALHLAEKDSIRAENLVEIWTSVKDYIEMAEFLPDLFYFERKHKLGFDIIFTYLKVISMFPEVQAEISHFLTFSDNKGQINQKIVSCMWLAFIKKLNGNNECTASQEELAFKLQQIFPDFLHAINLCSIAEGKSSILMLREIVNFIHEFEIQPIVYIKVLNEIKTIQDFSNVLKTEKLLSMVENIDVDICKSSLLDMISGGFDFRQVSQFIKILTTKTNREAKALRDVIELIYFYKYKNIVPLANDLKNINYETWVSHANKIIWKDGGVQVKSGQTIVTEYFADPKNKSKYLEANVEEQNQLLQNLNTILDQSMPSILKPEFGLITNWKENEVTSWAKEFRKCSKHHNCSTIEILSVIYHAKKISEGISLTVHQTFSILISILNSNTKNIYEIATGAGKTAIISCVAAFDALHNRTVDIYTSSLELAQRDMRLHEKFLAILDITVSCNVDSFPYSSGTKNCYVKNNKEIDIVYGTVSQFCFDFIRHGYFFHDTLGSRVGGKVILDEADNLLIDEFLTTAKLSAVTPGMDLFKTVYFLLWEKFLYLRKICFKWSDNYSYRIKEGFYLVKNDEKCLLVNNGEVCIPDWEFFLSTATPLDIQKVGTLLPDVVDWLRNYLEKYLRCLLLNEVAEPADICGENERFVIPEYFKPFVKRQIPNWVESCMAASSFKKLRDYVVEEDKVIPVDYQNTGDVRNMSQWGNGLQQFLQIDNKVNLDPESLPSNFLSVRACLKKYGNNIIGYTGTIGGSETQKFMKTVYDIDSIKVPEPYKNRRKKLETKTFEGKQEWSNFIKKSCKLQLKCKRGILIICKSISSAQEMFEELRDHFSKCKKNSPDMKLYTRNDKSEQYQVKKITSNQIIVATIVAARGTDICANDLDPFGGMHVILTFQPKDISRGELQVEGRTGRKGRLGSTQKVLHLRVGNSGQRYANYLDNYYARLPFQRAADNVFENYCEKLKQMRSEINKRYKSHGQNVEVPIILSTIETQWGMFLHEIENEAYPAEEIESKFQNLLKLLSSYIKNPIPEITNIFHHIQVGNAYLYESGWFDNYTTRAVTSYTWVLNIVSESERYFAAPAYLGLANIAIQNQSVDSAFYGYDDNRDNYKILALKYLNLCSTYAMNEYLHVSQCLSILEGKIGSNLSDKYRTREELVGKCLTEIDSAREVIQKSLRLFNVSAFDEKSRTFVRITKLHRGQHNQDIIELRKFSNYLISFSDLTAHSDLGKNCDQYVDTISNCGVDKISLGLENMTVKNALKLCQCYKFFSNLSKNEASKILEDESNQTKLKLAVRNIYKQKSLYNKIRNINKQTRLYNKISVSNAKTIISQQLLNASFDIDIGTRADIRDAISGCKTKFITEPMCFSDVEKILSNKPETITVLSLEIVGSTSESSSNESSFIWKGKTLQSSLWQNGALKSSEGYESYFIKSSDLTKLLRFAEANSDKKIKVEFQVDLSCQANITWLEALSCRNCTLQICDIDSKKCPTYIQFLRENNAEFCLILQMDSYRSLEKIIAKANLEQKEIYVRELLKLEQLYIGSYTFPKQIIQEYKYRGLSHFFTVYEEGPIQVRNCCALGFLTTAQIGAGIYFGQMSLLTEGLFDLKKLVYNSLYLREEMNWSNYAKSKGTAIALYGTCKLLPASWAEKLTIGYAKAPPELWKMVLISSAPLITNSVSELASKFIVSKFDHQIFTNLDTKLTQLLNQPWFSERLSRIYAIDVVFEENNLHNFFQTLIGESHNFRHSPIGKLVHQFIAPILSNVYTQIQVSYTCDKLIQVVLTALQFVFGSADMYTFIARMENEVIKRNLELYHARYSNEVYLTCKALKCTWSEAQGPLTSREYAKIEKFRMHLDAAAGSYSIDKISLFLKELCTFLGNMMHELCVEQVILPLSTFVTNIAVQSATVSILQKMSNSSDRNTVVEKKQISTDKPDSTLVSMQTTKESNSVLNDVKISQDKIPPVDATVKQLKSEPEHSKTAENSKLKDDPHLSGRKPPASRHQSKIGDHLPTKNFEAVAITAAKCGEISCKLSNPSAQIVDISSNIASLAPPTPYKIERINPKLIIYVKTGYLADKSVSLTCHEIVHDQEIPSDCVKKVHDSFRNKGRMLILVHGFGSSPAAWSDEVKDRVFKLDNNDRVICTLDWSEGSSLGLMNYPQAASNVIPTAEWLANILLKLCKSENYENKIYGIGHSLGAHLIGRTAEICMQNNLPFSRVTGLDPARPGFEGNPLLNYRCALIVDCIHTCEIYGSKNPHGTVDFYPNFGKNQPGWKPDIASGSHNFAHKFFIQSISNKGKFKTSKVLKDVNNKDVSDVEFHAEMGYFADGVGNYCGESGRESRFWFYLDVGSV